MAAPHLLNPRAEASWVITIDTHKPAVVLLCRQPPLRDHQSAERRWTVRAIVHLRAGQIEPPAGEEVDNTVEIGPMLVTPNQPPKPQWYFAVAVAPPKHEGAVDVLERYEFIFDPVAGHKAGKPAELWVYALAIDDVASAQFEYGFRLIGYGAIWTPE